jgi:ferritin
MKEIFQNSLKQSNPFATEEVIKALNYRIEQEEISSRLYESMSLWLNDNGFMGAAKAWAKDASDEMSHAKWAKNYLLDLGVKPTLPALPKPQEMFSGFPEIIKMSYKHEIIITKQCNELAKTALKNGDHLLYQLANKFLQEQQEELGKTQTAIDKLNTFGETKDVLFMIDLEYGKE